MYGFVLLLLAALAFMGWVLQGKDAPSDRFRLRLPAALGGVMILSSFITMPWIRFAPLDYLTEVVPDMLWVRAPELLSVLIRWLGHTGVAKLVSLFSSIGFLPGWLAMFLMPTKDIGIRTLIFLVALTGLLGAVWFLLSLFIRHRALCRGMGGFCALASFVVALLLLLNAPTLDAWASKGAFLPGLLALISGAHMGYGVWVAWVGLLLLGAGNAFDVFIVERVAVQKEEDF
jgi:hypothetical protein